MASLDCWRVSRLSHMPGAKVSVTVDPRMLTTQMYNKVLRMLETGMIAGGWRSCAVDLADTVLRATGVKPEVVRTWCHTIRGRVREENVQEVVDLMTADFAARRLDGECDDGGWLATRLHANIKDLRATGRLYYDLYDRGFYKQVLALVCSHEPDTEEAKEAVRKWRAYEPVVAVVND